jgi:hypothetical protein
MIQRPSATMRPSRQDSLAMNADANSPSILEEPHAADRCEGVAEIDLDLRRPGAVNSTAVATRASARSCLAEGGGEG